MYTITETDNKFFINNIEINEDALIAYCIEDREFFIDKLIDWISEARKETDKELMKQDLKMLIKRDDKYMLSSLFTNEYLFQGSEQFDRECGDILDRC